MAYDLEQRIAVLRVALPWRKYEPYSECLLPGCCLKCSRRGVLGDDGCEGPSSPIAGASGSGSELRWGMGGKASPEAVVIVSFYASVNLVSVHYLPVFVYSATTRSRIHLLCSDVRGCHLTSEGLHPYRGLDKSLSLPTAAIRQPAVYVIRRSIVYIQNRHVEQNVIEVGWWTS